MSSLLSIREKESRIFGSWEAAATEVVAKTHRVCCKIIGPSPDTAVTLATLATRRTIPPHTTNNS